MNKRQVKKIILGLGWLGLFLSVFSSSALAVDSQTTLYFGSHEKVLDESGGSLPAGRQVIEEKTYLSLPHVMVMKKGGEVFYLHQDHLSSTRLITDESGQIVEEYDYYPYGSLVSSDAMPSHLGGVEVVASPPTRSDYLPGVTSLFPGVSDKLYTSQTLDDSTNLYYYRARYYNPTTAHFLSADKAEGPNRYAYVAGNPISRNDPSGNRVGVPIRNLGLTEEELEYEAPERENFWQNLEAYGISLARSISPWVPKKWEQKLSRRERASINLNSSLMMVGMVSVSNQYVSKGGQKVTINPRDKGLRDLMKRAREYVSRRRTSKSIPRAQLVSEFLFEEIPYDAIGQQKIYSKGGQMAELGEFVNSAVCREKALMGHSILADMGKESWVVAGKTAFGRHAWVEMIDTITGKWHVMEPTMKGMTRYIERSQYYSQLGIGQKTLKYFQFLKP